MHDTEPGTLAPPGTETVVASGDAPSWLRAAALATGATVLGLGAMALALAIPGWYEPAIALPAGALAGAALTALAWPAVRTPADRGPRRAPRHAHVAAAAGLVVIFAVTGWNVSRASERVLIDRDPGAYTVEGRWIARSGGLEVRADAGPLAGVPELSFNSWSVFREPGTTRLSLQFAHMLPALLAQAHAVGGDGLLVRTPPIVGGAALLAFFVLAWRLLRQPWFAVAATVAFAVTLPQVAFSRDTHSEILSQLLVFSALWLLATGTDTPHWRVALAAGAFVGALQATRLDALAFITFLPLMFCVLWVRATRAGAAATARLARAGLAFAGGFAPMFLLGYLDLSLRSTFYFRHHSDNFRPLAQGAIVAAIVCTLVVTLWPRREAARTRVPVAPVSNAIGALVLVAGFGAWLVRPRWFPSRGFELELADLQRAEGLAVDLARRYHDHSLTWMSWYLGPVTVAAGIVAAALLARALARGAWSTALPAVAALAPPSALYLWNPRAFPDQVWVSRRLIASAVPALVLLGFGLAAVLWQSSRPDRPGRPGWPGWLARAGAAGIAVFGVVYPLQATWPVRDMASRRGYLAVVHDACRVLGDRAVVVVVGTGSGDLIPEFTPMTLRAFCGAEVAVMRGGVTRTVLERVAASARAAGRSLYLVSSGAAGVPEPPAIRTREAVNRRLLERTLVSRPDAYAEERFSLVVTKIDTA